MQKNNERSSHNDENSSVDSFIFSLKCPVEIPKRVERKIIKTHKPNFTHPSRPVVSITKQFKTENELSIHIGKNFASRFHKDTKKVGNELKCLKEEFMTTEKKFSNEEISKQIAHLAIEACTLAEKIAIDNKRRFCYKNMQHICSKAKEHIKRPNLAEINYQSQGILWIEKNFIFALLRLLDGWKSLQMILLEKHEIYNRIEDKYYNPQIRETFYEWQECTRYLIEDVLKTIKTLDGNFPDEVTTENNLKTILNNNDNLECSNQYKIQNPNEKLHINAYNYLKGIKDGNVEVLNKNNTLQRTNFNLQNENININQAIHAASESNIYAKPYNFTSSNSAKEICKPSLNDVSKCYTKDFININDSFCQRDNQQNLNTDGIQDLNYNLDVGHNFQSNNPENKYQDCNLYISETNIYIGSDGGNMNTQDFSPNYWDQNSPSKQSLTFQCQSNEIYNKEIGQISHPSIQNQINNSSMNYNHSGSSNSTLKTDTIWEAAKQAASNFVNNFSKFKNTENADNAKQINVDLDKPYKKMKKKLANNTMKRIGSVLINLLEKELFSKFTSNSINKIYEKSRFLNYITIYELKKNLKDQKYITIFNLTEDIEKIFYSISEVLKSEPDEQMEMITNQTYDKFKEAVMQEINFIGKRKYKKK